MSHSLHIQEKQPLLGGTTPQPSVKSKVAYAAGAFVSFSGFAFGCYSTYATIAHGRPLDLTKLFSSLVATVASGICTCHCCIKLADQFKPRQYEQQSSAEAGQVPNAELRTTIDRVGEIISQAKYQVEGTAPARINTQDPEKALTQLPTVIESLLKGLHIRAERLGDQNLKKDAELSQKNQKIQQLEAKILGQEAALSTHRSELQRKEESAHADVREAMKNEIHERLLKPFIDKMEGILLNPKYQHEGTTPEKLSLEEALAKLPTTIDTLLDVIVRRAESSEQESEQMRVQFEEQVRAMEEEIQTLLASTAPGPEALKVSEEETLATPAPALSPGQPSSGGEDLAARGRDIMARLEALKALTSPSSRSSSRPSSAPASPSSTSAPASPAAVTPSQLRGGKIPASPLAKMNQEDD